jgi:hypothetical protein
MLIGPYSVLESMGKMLANAEKHYAWPQLLRLK